MLASIVICSYVLIALTLLVTVAQEFVFFRRAGLAGWQAFVPIYRDVIKCKLMGAPLLFLALIYIPLLAVCYGVFYLSSFFCILLFIIGMCCVCVFNYCWLRCYDVGVLLFLTYFFLTPTRIKETRLHRSYLRWY